MRGVQECADDDAIGLDMAATAESSARSAGLLVWHRMHACGRQHAGVLSTHLVIHRRAYRGMNRSLHVCAVCGVR